MAEWDQIWLVVMVDPYNALRVIYSSEVEKLKIATSKYFNFKHLSTLLGSFGIDIYQELGCDILQIEFIIF